MTAKEGDAPAPGTHPLVPDYPADAFAGTAEFYARYRPPYPAALIDDLRAGIDRKSRLLDLACGTGQVALALAPHVGEVWALDREPEMLAVGQRDAAARGLANLRWIEGRAEDLQADAGAFQLVTVGNAFHRLQRRLVARRAIGWLAPNGRLAVLGSYSLWTGGEDWHAVARRVLKRWKRHDPVSGKNNTQTSETFDEALRHAGYNEIEDRSYAVPKVWSLEDLVGYAHSMSGLGRSVLGADAPAFEAELRESLLAYDPSGRYRETIRFFLILAKRP